ncbi:MAG: thrombospondin type 3 repeat-containing protein [Opitutales bacterium]
MELINKVIAFVFSVTVFSSTLLGGGLLWSDNDLAVWRDRAVNGPYKTAGDAFDPLVPGEWDRIVRNKSSFVASPTAGRVSTYDNSLTQIPVMKQHRKMLDAAFYALVKEDSATADLVVTELLWHANAAGMQISPTTYQGSDDNWLRAEWLKRIVTIADFVKDSFTAGERTTFNAWLSDWAYSFEGSVHTELSTNIFSNRYNRDYVTGLNYVATSPQYDGKYAYKDASGVLHNQIARVTKFYNNRRAHVAIFYGLAGIFLDDATLTDRGKLFFEEWLQFSVYPDGSMGEYERNVVDYNVNQGAIQYASVNIGGACEMASALATQGDNSLFTYSTSNGLWDSESTGGDPAKTIKLTVETFLDLIEHEKLWYHYQGSVSPEYLIDGKSDLGPMTGYQWLTEIYFAPVANRYWKDDRIKQGYMRTATGSIAYSNPIGPAGSYGGLWNGPAASKPSLLFMFAEMEDVGTGTVAPPVTPPTGSVYPQGYREVVVSDRTLFGLDPAWSADREFEAVFDGDVSTFYDYATSAETFAGIDFYEARVATSIVYHPRAGEENRMVGGRFEGSNESSVSGYETIHVIAFQPSASAQIINLQSAPAYRYYRYLAPAGGYGNIAEFSVEFPVLVAEVDSDNLPDEWEIQYFGGINAVNGGETDDFDGDGSSNYDEWLAGTDPSNATDFPVVTPPVGIVYPDGYREAMVGGQLVFGLDPAWSAGSEFGKVFDGDPSTYYDYINGAGGFAGMDLGESRVVTAINFQPRSGQAKRMIGGRFEGSNESSVSGYETIYVIAAEPSSTAQSVDVSSGMAYRYYRYLSPANGFGNIAEFSLELEVVVADTDNLPDEWEIQYFGGINAVNGAEAEDFDGDGSSNYDEWLAGTDPSNATDFPVVTPPVTDGLLSSTQWQNLSIELQSGQFSAEYDVVPNVSNMNGTTGLSFGNAATWDDLAVIVGFSDAGQLNARNGDVYTADTVVPYSAGTSYHFRIVGDIPAHTYSVYVTEGAGAEIQLANNYAFRSSQAAVSSLDTLAVVAATGSHTVSNFTISASVALDTIAPSVPVGLSASAVSTTQINLTWTASSDAVGVAGYKIYREGVEIGSTDTSSYSDVGLSASSSYAYSLAAYDAAGNYSSQSAAVSASTAPEVDSDNLPDDWEIQYFGDINAVNGAEAEDFDGDGISNYDEWLAGTDPSDATDLLELRPVVGVAWASVRDRSYEIDYSDNNWKTFITSETLLGGGGPMVWIDPSDGTLIHKRQYRVQVVAQ